MFNIGLGELHYRIVFHQETLLGIENRLEDLQEEIMELNKQKEETQKVISELEKAFAFLEKAAVDERNV